jgi:hypothetical protein
MQKVKVLVATQYDKSGVQLLRVYFDFDQAETDKELLEKVVHDKEVSLIEVEIYDKHAKHDTRTT